MSEHLSPWERRAHEGASRLEDEVRKAGPDGLTRSQLIELTLMGKETFRDAERLLAEAPGVTRTEESRLNRGGHMQSQVVFRHIDANPSGFVPARVSRDPAVQGTLGELSLIEAVEQAKAAGRRKPRAIARWILKHPLRAREVFNWVDVEGLLAARIEELERDRDL